MYLNLHLDSTSDTNPRPLDLKIICWSELALPKAPASGSNPCGFGTLVAPICWKENVRCAQMILKQPTSVVVIVKHTIKDTPMIIK